MLWQSTVSGHDSRVHRSSDAASLQCKVLPQPGFGGDQEQHYRPIRTVTVDTRVHLPIAERGLTSP